MMPNYESVENGSLGKLHISYINSLMSLVYAMYIRKFTKQTHPVEKVIIPSLHNVNKFLNDSELITRVRLHMIDDLKSLITNEWWYNMFKGEFDILNKVDMYIDHIIDRSSTYILNIIRNKFDNAQLFKESHDLLLIVKEDYYDYIIHEIALNMILLSVNTVKSIMDYDHSTELAINRDMIVTIRHEQDLSPIHLNVDILKLDNVMELINFVTTSNVTRVDDTYYMTFDEHNKVVINQVTMKGTD